MFRWPWTRIRDGERRAEFEALARAHADDLYNAALRMCRNADDARDLVQDTLIKAFRGFGGFSTGTNFKAWSLRILTNLYINEFRKRARTSHCALDDEEATCANVFADSHPDMSPDGRIYDEVLDEEIERALGELGEGVRLCVLLVDVEELSYEDTAASLGVPVGTVRSRLNRGREQLRLKLGKFVRERNLV